MITVYSTLLILLLLTQNPTPGPNTPEIPPKTQQNGPATLVSDPPSTLTTPLIQGWTLTRLELSSNTQVFEVYTLLGNYVQTGQALALHPALVMVCTKAKVSTFYLRIDGITQPQKVKVSSLFDGTAKVKDLLTSPVPSTNYAAGLDMKPEGAYAVIDMAISAKAIVKSRLALFGIEAGSSRVVIQFNIPPLPGSIVSACGIK